MSVIIADMPMPKNCRKCMFKLNNEGGKSDYICKIARQLDKNCYFDNHNDRPKDCPLSETLNEEVIQRTIDSLKAIQKENDAEDAHRLADNELCRLLSALGFENVVSEYGKIKKWYA